MALVQTSQCSESQKKDFKRPNDIVFTVSMELLYNVKAFCRKPHQKAYLPFYFMECGIFEILLPGYGIFETQFGTFLVIEKNCT